MPAVFELPPIAEGNTVVLLARFENDDGTALIRAEISSVSIKCYDLGDPANTVTSATPAVADVFFDTLSTGLDWDVDTEGWNFKYKCPSTFFPQGGRTYKVEVTVTEASGDLASQIWLQPTANLLSR